MATACATAAARGLSGDGDVATCTAAIANEDLPRNDLIGVYTNRGAILLRRHDGAGALADFDHVLALDEDNAQGYVNRGAALVMVGRPGPAVATLTQALLLGVRSPHIAYYNRGAAREALGDLRGAYEDYSTALAIQPDWGPAEAELARFARSRREQLASVIAAPEGGAGQPAGPP